MLAQHCESGTKVHKGRITKQDNRLVRWAAVEAVQRWQLGNILTPAPQGEFDLLIDPACVEFAGARS